MASRLDYIGDLDALAWVARLCGPKLAALCGMTPRHLRRCFRARFGMSLQHRLEFLRLNRSAELILHGWCVKAVATELGWGKPSNFCHAFKKHFGMSPLRYFTAQQHCNAKPWLPPNPWPCGSPDRRPEIQALLGRHASSTSTADASFCQNHVAVPKNGKSRAQSRASELKMSFPANNVRPTQ